MTHASEADRFPAARKLIADTEAEPRTYRVEYRHDYRPDAAGLDWRLYTYGTGHWCAGAGHSGTFRSEAEAEARGKFWALMGKPPCHQPKLNEVERVLAEAERKQQRRAA